MMKIGRRLVVTLCCFALGWGLTGCQSSTADNSMDIPPVDIDTLTLSLELVASGLDTPLSITHADDERLLIIERPGRLRIWRAGALIEQPFLDITPQVRSGGEQGFLGVAFHPNYQVVGALGEGLFWVNYTNIDGDTIIARYSVSADNPDRADPTSERILLTIDQPFRNHNGGQLQFGPAEGLNGERYLYIGMGDGGSGGDPLDHAQRDDSLLGKMLRIAPSTELAPVAPFYTIPPDNPRVGAQAPLDTIWANGLRNPWRFSFDAELGDLYIGDVGQNAFEEVNVTEAGTSGDINYGWRFMEGFACFNPQDNCDDGTLTLPVVAYQQRNGRCAVIGGYVYRGSQFPGLNGVYLYADFCTGEIFGFRFDAAMAPSPIVLHTHDQNVLAFGEDVTGELYLMDASGAVHRIVAE